MLTAVGVQNLIAHIDDRHALLVPAELEATAREHLARYAVERAQSAAAAAAAERESLRLRRRLLHPHAWVGSAGYVLLLLGITFVLGAGFGPLDAYERGLADAQLIRQGEWWRAITALTLHADAAHLLANLAGGAWFGYLAGRRLGPGHAWFLTVTAAAFANLVEGWFGPVPHRSLGASTAVFAALGLLVANAWKEQSSLRTKWVLRWGPLVGGALLLGWLGTAGENTDVMSHVLGFACGGALGWLVSQARVPYALARVPQWLTGALSVALVLVAWIVAARA